MNQTAFLLSSWYSGATLLTLLLDAQPRVVSNGEGLPFSSEVKFPVCSCGAALQECEFYRYAAAHMWAGQCYDPDLFLREPNLDLPKTIQRFAMTPRFPGSFRHYAMAVSKEYRRKLAHFSRAHIRFMRQATDFSGADVYLDATKSLRRAEILLRDLRGRKHLWLLVRDCRAYCASVLRHRKWPSQKAPLAAREWRNYIHFSKKLAKKYPQAAFRTVRYEDLCVSPLAVINDLLADLGVPRSNKIYGEDQNHHILGNRMRMRFDGKIELREEWRTMLDKSTENEIMRISGGKMAEFGYI